MTEEVAQWLEIANGDMGIAQFLFDNRWPRPLEYVCYLSQQCGEKALKAYLIHCGVEFPFTHDLRRLCKICMKHSDAFGGLYEFCAALTPYAVDTKYPSKLELDEAMAVSALRKAEAILETVTSEIGNANGDAERENE